MSVLSTSAGKNMSTRRNPVNLSTHQNTVPTPVLASTGFGGYKCGSLKLPVGIHNFY